MAAEVAVAAACQRSGVGEVRDLRRRTGGELSEVYEVYAGGRTDPVIVKVYAPEWTWKQSKEVYVYRLIEPVLPGLIPRIIDVWSSGVVDDLACTVMTCLPGQPLSESAAALDAATLRDLYRQLGEQTRRLHTLRQDAFGYLVDHIIDPLPDNASYVRTQFAKKLAALGEVGLPARLIDRVEQRQQAADAALGQPVQAVLCHNDLHEGNLLVENTSGRWSLTGIIDVENAIAADPLHDLAKTDCYSIRGDMNKFAGLAEGYLLNLDQPEQVRYQLYRIYHTIELLAWFHQIGYTEPLESLTQQLTGLLDDETST